MHMQTYGTLKMITEPAKQQTVEPVFYNTFLYWLTNLLITITFLYW